ncbi:complement factor H-like isoform X3 [Dermochelys coriacea]|uniref:complement factor H-like isoform X3 n=1 Tax=Dermochelys coriacea TaxID=27794 RepID=UPI001CA9E1B3|nr:complement factor H-like isoform X3 [Dermochelys coriacea]
MALQVSALALLLALPPVLSAQGAGLPSSSRPKTPDTCRREGAWTTKVTFPSELTAFPMNGTVLVICTEKPESGTFPAKCTELKDRGAVWDISGVQCLRMCNDWVRQVDFDPAQTEFGVGAEGRVTCRQQFQQNSFNVTCRETESGHFEWELGAHKCVRKCKIFQTWDSRLQFSPKRQFYSPGESVTLSCSEGYRPSPPVIECVRNGSLSVWSETPTCQGVCTTAGNWPPSVSAVSARTEFAVGERVWVTCLQEQYEGRSAWMQCTERPGRVEWDTSHVSCVEKCPKPSWASALRFAPDKIYYSREEPVTLSCPEAFKPSHPMITCTGQGNRSVWNEIATCLEKCEIRKPWDSRLQFSPKRQFYSPSESVTLSCSEGYRPSPPVIECVRNGSLSVWSETPTCQGVCTTAGNWPPSVSAVSARTEFAVGERVWVTCLQEQYEGRSAWMQCTERPGRVEWDTSHVSCVEKCPKPSWASALRFAPDKIYYSREEPVTLSCPEAFEPSHPMITCTGQGNRSVWNEIATCLGVCTTAGNWPPSVSAVSARTEFAVGERVWVTCLQEQYEGRSAWMQCTERPGRVEWDMSHVSCVEKCPRPQWDPRLRFVPDWPFYGQNEQTRLSCSGGVPGFALCDQMCEMESDPELLGSVGPGHMAPYQRERYLCGDPPDHPRGPGDFTHHHQTALDL